MLKPNCSLGDVMRAWAETAGAAKASAPATANAIGNRRRAVVVGPRMNAPMERIVWAVMSPTVLERCWGAERWALFLVKAGGTDTAGWTAGRLPDACLGRATAASIHPLQQRKTT